jgi:hypothetical protein
MTNEEVFTMIENMIQQNELYAEYNTTRAMKNIVVLTQIKAALHKLYANPSNNIEKITHEV